MYIIKHWMIKIQPKLRFVWNFEDMHILLCMYICALRKYFRNSHPNGSKQHIMFNNITARRVFQFINIYYYGQRNEPKNKSILIHRYLILHKYGYELGYLSQNILLLSSHQYSIVIFTLLNNCIIYNSITSIKIKPIIVVFKKLKLLNNL